MQLNELEEAVRWYVGLVDRLAPFSNKFLLNTDEIGDDTDKRHAKLLRKYRKDYDENRDDN